MRNIYIIIVLFSGIVITNTQAQAVEITGKIDCFYEIYSKKTWPKSIKTNTFSFNIETGADVSTPSSVLDNVLRMRYQPGYRNNKLSYFIYSLTYADIHAGADIPVTESLSSVYFSRDGSDLIGGFLNCKAKLD
ncbi:MAG: hypothetical protein HOO06_10970 [Bdellovibrionaceae bacterium]|jgi:hypothetical protein|nr:hypothetical protein [Pseudobdellovibrionaceae bacterium]